MKKYWIEALFVHPHTGDILEGECGKDGLLVRLHTNEAKPLLVQLHCPEKDGVWFFNNTYDRYIAEEESEGYITANPQLIWQNGYEIIT